VEQRGQIVEVSGDVWVFRTEALLVDGECAAHQRLGLAEAVRVLEQLGQVVEAVGDLWVFRAEAFLVDGERPAHQWLGLAEAVRGLEQHSQVVEGGGDVWMFRAEALLVDGERPAHQRLGLAEAVRGLEQHSQVVEGGGDVWVFRAEALLVDGERPAHQRLGLAEAVRGLEQRGQVVEGGGDLGMFRPEALLGNCERSALQRLGLGPLGQLIECDTEPAQQNRVFTTQALRLAKGRGRQTVLRLLVLGSTQIPQRLDEVALLLLGRLVQEAFGLGEFACHVCRDSLVFGILRLCERAERRFQLVHVESVARGCFNEDSFPVLRCELGLARYPLPPRIAHFRGDLADRAAAHEHDFRLDAGCRDVDQRVDEKPFLGLLGLGDEKKDLDRLPRPMLGRQVQLRGAGLAGRQGFKALVGETEAGERMLFVIARHQQDACSGGCGRERHGDQKQGEEPELFSSHGFSRRSEQVSRPARQC